MSQGPTSLSQTLEAAFKKLGTQKESVVCHYIPGDSGGYIHHFTFKKMKTEEPEALANLITTYILDPTEPKVVPPKQRAARGSRKKKDTLQLNRQAVEKLLYLARTAGDKEAISLLMPNKSLSTCKKELIHSIKQGQVEPELWNAYTEAVRANNFVNSAVEEATS